MKTATLILSLLIIPIIGFAQTSKSVQGPKAKNQKVWKDDSPKSILVASTEVANLKGPAAKNQKPWMGISGKKQPVIVGNTKHLKGPKAKNQKPWKKYATNKVKSGKATDIEEETPINNVIQKPKRR